MGRVVARALITLYRAAEMPHNSTYILRNTEQGWATAGLVPGAQPRQISRDFVEEAGR